MQNLFALSRTVWANVGGSPRKIVDTWDVRVVDTLEIRYSPTCVIIPNFVAPGQTYSKGVPKHFGDAGPRTAWDWGVVDHPRNTLLPACITVPNFTALDQTVWA